MYAQYLQPAPKEVRVSKFIRQFHRWTSAVFVLSVIATTIVLTQPNPMIWFSYVPLAPLAVLALTGIYMFVLPYLPKRRAGA
jgi:hypothetical protein